MRNITLLNSDWRFLKNASAIREAVWPQGIPVTLPHTWNAIDGQDGGNDYYRGTCWYIRRLMKPVLTNGGRAYLEFNGAAMTAEVYLNGEKTARHEGGFSTFRVDITDHLQEENILAVSVDNSANDRIYPQKADFTFYGGLYRDVKLITVPTAHFALECAGGPGIKVTPKIIGKNAEVAVEVWTENAEGDTVLVNIRGAGETRAVVENGKAVARLLIENVHLWNGLDDPYLYTVTAALSEDEISARFGCRTFFADPEKGFFLNGQSYPLRGVARHQDRAGAGNAITKEMHKEDLDIIREMGANSIRLAHYQHDQYFYDLCDEAGMVVWAEIPYISMHMPNGREDTLAQMKELVVQNYNHPSIVCWGLSNEITIASAVTEDLLENHRLLNELCHKLDKTRPTTIANVFLLETDNPILKIPDLIGYNLYFGWYIGGLKQYDRFFDKFHAEYPNRSIGLSEYGADANPIFQTANPERGDYSETYQTVYHEYVLNMINQRPYIWSSYLWNMFDFAADGRNEGGTQGVNQKGLVTMDRKLKKDTFYLYKAYWSKEPFVHVCGSRYIDRTEDATEIKVYSNQPEIMLYLDGKPFEKQKGMYIYKFQVPLSGEHVIEAKAGQKNSKIFVRKVMQPNRDYMYIRKGDVVNWFSQDDYKLGYFSIKDTIGPLTQNPAANGIVSRLIARTIKRKDDITESVVNNYLQTMMNMTLQEILKQAGDTVKPEQIKNLNATLQQIKK